MTQTVLEEAEALTSGDRLVEYGDPSVNLADTARLWSVVLGINVTPQQVCLCMVCLKLARMTGEVDRDSIVDSCGYLRLVEKMGLV